MDYDTIREFGIPIEYTIFIPITKINKRNGGTEIWPDAYLGEHVDSEILMNSGSSVTVTSDIASVYAISSNTHHRGLRNRSNVPRDIIAIRVSAGIPCDDINEPCHIGKHQITFGVSIENRERSSKMFLQNLDMMPVDQRAFILELRSAISFKTHRAKHRKLGKKPTIRDYLQRCDYCLDYNTTNPNLMKRHKKKCKKEKFRVSKEQLTCHCMNGNMICNKTFLLNSTLKRHVREVHNQKSTSVCQLYKYVDGIPEICGYISKRRRNFIRHQQSLHIHV